LWMLNTCGSSASPPLKNSFIRPPKCPTEAILIWWVEGFLPFQESFSQRNKYRCWKNPCTFRQGVSWSAMIGFLGHKNSNYSLTVSHVTLSRLRNLFFRSP
jgi:hypothetical protein